MRRLWQLPRPTSRSGRVSASSNKELRRWEGPNQLEQAARCSPHRPRWTLGMLARVADRVLESGRETVLIRQWLRLIRRQLMVHLMLHWVRKWLIVLEETNLWRINPQGLALRYSKAFHNPICPCLVVRKSWTSRSDSVMDSNDQFHLQTNKEWYSWRNRNNRAHRDLILESLEVRSSEGTSCSNKDWPVAK